MICGSGGSKSTLAKAAGAEPSGPDERWKVARRCGAKHISKSKCTKHTNLGPLLEADMSKNCTPLWREAHFQVKSAKNERYGALLDVQASFCVAGAGAYAPCQKWGKCEGFVPVSTTITTTLHYTPLHYTTLHYDTLRYTTITLHYTTLHYNCNCNFNYNYTLITLEYATPHYTKLHYTNYSYNYNYATLHYTRLHYPTLHYTTLITPPQMQLQLHYTSYTTPRSTTLQLQLQLQAALDHTTSSSCGWGPLQPLYPFQQTQLQPPFSPSVDSLCHPWITTTKLSYRFSVFETSATALCGTTGNNYY